MERPARAHPPVSLTRFGGYAGAWAISLTVMAMVVALTYLLARRGPSGPPPLDQPPVAHGAAGAVRGSWPLWVGALVASALAGQWVLHRRIPGGLAAGLALRPRFGLRNPRPTSARWP